MNHITTQLLHRRTAFGKTPAERFLETIIKSDGCWNWPRAKDGCGYGWFRVIDYMFRAHRVSWVVHFGDIPEGKLVLHKCDNPACVNPSHLFIGDQKINMQDCVNKGRKKRGEDVPASKLTAKEVIAIRDMFSLGLNMAEIARIVGVSFTNISSIVKRNTWKHI